jgi:type IV pilus assembly protein PilC
MLSHVAIAYENQVDARLATLTSLLGPLMIVVMGVMAGSIALSILLPLMQINEFVQ